MFNYDVFISYRRQEPDQDFAIELDRRLQGCGFKVAIDRRDFGANKQFVTEIERCINTSKFTFVIISSRYFDSGNTMKEAVIAQTQDMANREDRLVPIIIEECQIPYWIYGISGINFVDQSPGNEPYSRMIDLLTSDLNIGPVDRGPVKPLPRDKMKNILHYGSVAVTSATGAMILTDVIRRIDTQNPTPDDANADVLDGAEATENVAGVGAVLKKFWDVF